MLLRGRYNRADTTYTKKKHKDFFISRQLDAAKFDATWLLYSVLAFVQRVWLQMMKIPTLRDYRPTKNACTRTR